LPAGSTAGSKTCGTDTAARSGRRSGTGRSFLALWIIVAVLTVAVLSLLTTRAGAAEDQGFFFGYIQSSPNATLDQTKLFTDQIYGVYKSFPEAASIFQLTQPGGAWAGWSRGPGASARRRHSNDDGGDGAVVENRRRARDPAGSAAAAWWRQLSRGSGHRVGAEPKQLSELATSW